MWLLTRLRKETYRVQLFQILGCTKTTISISTFWWHCDKKIAIFFQKVWGWPDSKLSKFDDSCFPLYSLFVILLLGWKRTTVLRVSNPNKSDHSTIRSTLKLPLSLSLSLSLTHPLLLLLHLPLSRRHRRTHAHTFFFFRSHSLSQKPVSSATHANTSGGSEDDWNVYKIMSTVTCLKFETTNFECIVIF